MFSERDSTGAFGGFGQRSATLWLTVGFVIVFALQCINDVYLHTPVEGWLALTRRGVLDGWVWQLLTFQLLHADFFHLVFNLIVFWWLGHFCEGLMGVRRFLVALFGCGAVGGLLQGALMVFFPQHFGAASVGASAGVFGLLSVFALCERDAEIRLYFVIPVRAIWVLWASLAISAFFTLVPTPASTVWPTQPTSAGCWPACCGTAWVGITNSSRFPGPCSFNRFGNGSRDRRPDHVAPPTAGRPWRWSLDTPCPVRRRPAHPRSRTCRGRSIGSSTR